MAFFLDTENRKWVLTITVGTIKRVRSATGIDLAGALDGDTLQRIGADPVLLVEVLASILESQLEKAGVTPEAFGESLGGDALDHAGNALLDAIAEFFPSPKRRLMQGILQKTRAQTEQAIAQAMAQIENTDLLSIAGPSSSDSPASPE